MTSKPEVDHMISSEAKILQWCPKMDLLAIIMIDNTTIIQRLSTWQKILTIDPDDFPITAFSWSPNGNSFAIGHENGAIIIYNTETGKKITSLLFHSVSITILSWLPIIISPTTNIYNEFIQGAHEESELRDRVNFFFTQLPSLHSLPQNNSNIHPHISIDAKTEKELINNEKKTENTLNIIASGDIQGNVHLSSSGITSLCQMKVSGPVLGICLNPDMSSLIISHISVPESHLKSNSKANIKSNNSININNNGNNPHNSYFHPITLSSNTCVISFFNTFVLKKHAQVLYNLNSQSVYLIKLLDYCSDTIKTILGRWNIVHDQVSRKFKLIEQLYEDDGINNINYPDELISLALLGKSKDSPMNRFMSDYLHVPQLQRLSANISSTFDQIYAITHLYLQPAMEEMMFRVTELRSMTRMYMLTLKENTNSLCDNSNEDFTNPSSLLIVHFKEYSSIIYLISDFISSLEKYQMLLSNKKEDYSDFFTWLLDIKRSKENNEEEHKNTSTINVFRINKICKFLTDFRSDKVRNQLINSKDDNLIMNNENIIDSDRVISKDRELRNSDFTYRHKKINRNYNTQSSSFYLPPSFIELSLLQNPKLQHNSNTSSDSFSLVQKLQLITEKWNQISKLSHSIISPKCYNCETFPILHPNIPHSRSTTPNKCPYTSNYFPILSFVNIPSPHYLITFPSLSINSISSQLCVLSLSIINYKNDYLYTSDVKKESNSIISRYKSITLKATSNDNEEIENFDHILSIDNYDNKRYVVLTHQCETSDQNYKLRLFNFESILNDNSSYITQDSLSLVIPDTVSRLTASGSRELLAAQSESRHLLIYLMYKEDEENDEESFDND